MELPANKPPPPSLGFNYDVTASSPATLTPCLCIISHTHFVMLFLAFFSVSRQFGCAAVCFFFFSSFCLICRRRTGSAVCLHFCVSVCVCVCVCCQTGTLLSCCQSLSRLSSRSRGLDFLPRTVCFASVTKKAADRFRRGDYI